MQGWLRCGGYKSAALVAVGHDHIRLWQALHPAGAPPGPEAPVPDAEELVQLAAVAGQAGLNFPLDCYTDDSMLLVKLHRSSLPDLQVRRQLAGRPAAACQGSRPPGRCVQRHRLVAAARGAHAGGACLLQELAPIG